METCAAQQDDETPADPGLFLRKVRVASRQTAKTDTRIVFTDMSLMYGKEKDDETGTDIFAFLSLYRNAQRMNRFFRPGLHLIL
jgi:hypothetical protein